MLNEGTTAPSFTLPNQDGESVSLSDFSGQWVVVYFYPRADTPGCTTEACEFRDAWDQYTERDITVLGISDDPVDDIAAFVEKYDLPFPLLGDEDGAVASEYDSYGEKTVFGNTVMGTYRNTFVIDPDGTIDTALHDVSPDGHADEILESIPVNA